MIRRFLVAGLLVLLASIPIRAQLATATVTPGTPGKSVQPDFGGITTDVFSSATMVGTPANGKNLIYRQLAKNLIFPKQSLFFTMEGDDSPSATLTADHVLGQGNVFTDLQAAGFGATWHMPANMCSNNQSFANGEVNLYTANMPFGSLAGIVLGNEPDGVCSATYGGSYAAFKTKWDTYRSGINALSGASTMKFMAPSLGGELSNIGYRGSLNSFVTAEAAFLTVASQHWYALNNTSAGCGGNTPTITQLLAGGAATPATIDSNFPNYVTNAHTQGLPFRMTEMNTVVCGGASGVSNTFAAALWLPDALFNLANIGVDGVGIFSDIGQFYDMFGFTIGGSAPNKTYAISFIRPEYYGFLMFQEATQHLSKLIPCTITTSSNVTCWGTIDELNTVRVVVINKDQVATGNVTINLAGYGSANLKLLTAPAVTSTTGVTYGGKTFDGSTDGTILGTDNSTTLTPSGGAYTFSMAKASAALLTLQSGSVTIVQQPQTQTVLASQQATFKVIATGVTSYQWQKNGVAIPGATSPSYITPSAVTADSGTAFTVVLNGTLTSSTATLFVNSLVTSAGWTKIPGTILYHGTENHTPCPPNGFRSWTMTMGSAWSDTCNNVYLDPGGAVMDYSRNRLCIMNGGHNDYGGNEVYCLNLALAGKDISGNTFVANANTYGPFVRMTNPGPPNTNSGLAVETLPAATSLPQAGFSGTVAFPDPTRPTPNSRHVYAGVEYVPTSDGHGMFVMVNGALNATGGSGNHTWTLDLSSLDMNCAVQLTPSNPCDPLWTDVGNAVPAAGAGSMLEYDLNNGRLWLFENLNGQLYQNVPGTWPGWVSAGAFGAVAGSHSTSVLDPDDDYFIHIGNLAATDSFGYWNLKGWIPGGANPTHVVPTLDSTCTTIRDLMATNKKYYPGLFWHPIRKRVVMYPGFGNALYTIDPKQSTWTCKSETYGTVQGVDYPQDSRTTVGAEGGEGTFTKFNYSPTLDTMVLMNDSNADAWYGRMRPLVATIKNTSGSTLTNKPITISPPLKDGDVAQCARVYIDGVARSLNNDSTGTQTDVKNRYPSGNLKFAAISFILPSLANSATAEITLDSQPNCNNGSQQTKTQMLAAPYNFDAQIQLTGTSSPTISARTMLNTNPGSDCVDMGADIEGMTGNAFCYYWLKGPIVTGIIIEDRAGRSFDVNTDAGTGNPLHPSFEAWFYPQDNGVQIGMSMEDIWASTTATNSARDQTYNATLTIGNTAPTTVLGPTGSIKQQTRTRWHRTFWLNVADPLSLVTIDRNYRYLATTKFTPNWDPNLVVTATTLSSGPNPMQCTPAFYNTTSRGLVNTNTVGNFSVGCIPIQIAATGAAEYHGALPTWDIACLMSQDPNVCKVSFQSGPNGGHSDLINEVPYFYREADATAGHGGFFEADGTIGTQGRVVSINARTQVSLNSVASPNTCNVNFAPDYINFGTGGEDIGPWGANNLDTTHEGNGGYLSYLMTGQYFHYSTVLMQGAYAIGLGPGNRACAQATSNQSLRNGASGYWYVDQERGQTWIARDNALAAFIAVDLSPEKKYFENFLKQNISVWQGARGLANDYPANSTAYNYGSTSRKLNNRGAGKALGAWTQGQGFVDGSGSNYVIAAGSLLNQTGPNTPQSANAQFQNAYSAVVVAWIDDLGYTPSGNLRALMANHYLNIILNPAANILDLASYVYPTQDNAALQTNISTWPQNQTFYASHATAWPTCNVGVDEGFQYTALGATSQYYNLISQQGGYSGAAAWTALLASTNCPFTTGSPKWALAPRFSTARVAAGTPTAPIVTLTPASLTFSNQGINTTSPTQTIQLSNTGTASLSITSITLTGANPGDYSIFSNACGASLAQGLSCNIGIRFTPSSVGSRTANLTFTTNAASSPENAALSGTGVAPIASFSPPALAFPAIYVGQPNGPLAITLTNTGNVTMTISSISISGTNAGDFSQSNTCGPTLAASANCVINVTFTPLTAGVRQANIVVTDNTVLGTDTVALSGTGFLPITGVGTISGTGTIKVQP